MKEYLHLLLGIYHNLKYSSVLLYNFIYEGYLNQPICKLNVI